MLEVKDLRVHFLQSEPGHDAVRGISFTIADGEMVGLVGESGSGKSVTAMAISGLLQRRRAECSGSIHMNGRDLLTLDRAAMRTLQGREMAVVFQEPMSSFDPCMRMGPQIEEALLLHPELSEEERRAAAIRAMEEAELPDPEAIYNKYPHELSGGMLQRAMIASAIISSPSLLICDEPTTALDVTIQSQILDLLKKINREKGTSILLISHNLSVVRKLCGKVLIMHRGEIVEQGDVEQIFNAPEREYTKQLIASIPTRDRRLRDIYAAQEARI